MNTGIKKAVASTTARTNELHRESYLKVALLSRAKEQIGLLLFCLQISTETDRQTWQQFEIVLKRYVDLKLNEVKL